jgi:glycosyltransferase involved in cell wall biosynthesis
LDIFETTTGPFAQLGEITYKLAEKTPLRIALFTDSYHELNGVGTVSREFAAFARRKELPFCCVRSGAETSLSVAGSVTHIELKRGLKMPLDQDLYCDPLLNRYLKKVLKELREFRPDVIHITGPGDLGILGFWISNILGVPMAASWHTNIHEYASRRLEKTLRPLPRRLRESAAKRVEILSLKALTSFYRLAHFVIAPNQAMVDLLGKTTGRPAYRMGHGVDTARFGARLRQRNGNGNFCIGYVGRLTPEKNVRAFAELERELHASGENHFRMLLVGDGSEREWLRRSVPGAEMPGFLTGEKLAAAFADMDAFVFPSKTDTFGLVVLEAMASGVPVVVSPEAGMRVGIRDGAEGFLSGNFADGVRSLMRCGELRRRMGEAAEAFAATRTWDGVFEGLYETYTDALTRPEVRQRIRPAPSEGKT